MYGSNILKSFTLRKLDKHEDDQTILNQGSKFHDRVFLPSAKDRKLLRKLVTEEIRAAEFLGSQLESENGELVREVIDRLYQVYDDVPDAYLPLLTDLGKYTSVTGKNWAQSVSSKAIK